MKKQSKKRIKKKKDFRFHNVELFNKKGKKKTLRHPAYVFLEKGNIYVYVSITHSRNVDGVIVIKLRKNPNPKDTKESFRVVGAKEDSKDRFGKRQKGWKMDDKDDSEIRDEYKKR